MSEDRLKKLEQIISRKKTNRTQLLWVTYNPEATYKYDLADAREDVEWMIHEIRRLREENAMLHEFVDTLRAQMAEELNNTEGTNS